MNLNPLSLVSDAAKSVVSTVLPGSIGKVVGDVVAGAIDFQTGNLPGLMQDCAGALKDLPQAASALSGKPPGTPSTASDPSPPPSSAASSTAVGKRTHGFHLDVMSLLGKVQDAAKNVDPSKMSKDDFMALANDAFMQAVRDGKIPKDIQDSPAAMQALQARMNQVSEMNQLMTAMLQAMHQMQMSIIQNVRV
jgi:hypothetical protein